MRKFSLDTTPLLTPKVVGLLTEIHECKGKQELYMEANRDALTTLLQVATIQSVDASNRLEGIFTSDARLKALMNEKTKPRNRSEEEILGYRKVLKTIHKSYDAITIKPAVILQLHRDLYSYSAQRMSGRWKNTGNAIVEKRADGIEITRFQPLSVFETPDAMQKLCDVYAKKIDEAQDNPLLLCCMFILDFLCIHPFNDGNGRMSRLLTLLMLYRSGYIVGKYISLEMLIEHNKESYYDSLQASSLGWHNGGNNYEPFVTYMLGIILAAYRDFNSRVEYLRDKSISKPDRIRKIFESRLDLISRNELALLCPDISETTIRHTLTQLVKEGYIVKMGSARATKYIRNHQ